MFLARLPWRRGGQPLYRADDPTDPAECLLTSRAASAWETPSPTSQAASGRLCPSSCEHTTRRSPGGHCWKGTPQVVPHQNCLHGLVVPTEQLAHNPTYHHEHNVTGFAGDSLRAHARFLPAAKGRAVPTLSERTTPGKSGGTSPCDLFLSSCRDQGPGLLHGGGYP